MKKYHQTKKGSVLVFALIILTMLLVSAIAVITVAVTEKRSAFTTQKSVIAFQAADSGAERILKRIYINNSPPISSVPLNSSLLAPADSTLNNLINNLAGVVLSGPDAPTCSSGVIKAKNFGEPAYSFEIVLYDNSENIIGCNNLSWRDRVVKMRSTGQYRGISRFIEVGVRARQ